MLRIELIYDLMRDMSSRIDASNSNKSIVCFAKLIFSTLPPPPPNLMTSLVAYNAMN